MKILYGVCGEGLGHAVRSAVVGRHLVDSGHDVTFCSSGRAQQHLEKRFPHQVLSVVGLGSVISRNQVSPGLTLLRNLATQAVGLLPNALACAFAWGSGRPDVIISDFEPVTARWAAWLGVPCLAVDNIHFMNRCRHPPSMVRSHREAAALMHPVAENVVPDADHYFVLTFVRSPVIKPATSLHLPILRPEILDAKQEHHGQHVVAYFNDKANHEDRLRMLRDIRVPVHVYGLPGVTSPVQRGNVTLLPLAEADFIQDLASAHAAISGAGFTMMTEAMYLGTPLLAVPTVGHFEQILNAEYLRAFELGEHARDLTTPAIASFLERVPRYHQNLSRLSHDRNASLLSAVDYAIGAVA